MSQRTTQRGKRLTKSELLSLYESMLSAQKEGGDFDLTIRELMVIWGYPNSTSSARYHLPKLIEAGLVKSKMVGKKHVYRAVEANQQ